MILCGQGANLENKRTILDNYKRWIIIILKYRLSTVPEMYFVLFLLLLLHALCVE